MLEAEADRVRMQQVEEEVRLRWTVTNRRHQLLQLGARMDDLQLAVEDDVVGEGVAEDLHADGQLRRVLRVEALEERADLGRRSPLRLQRSLAVQRQRVFSERSLDLFETRDHMLHVLRGSGNDKTVVNDFFLGFMSERAQSAGLLYDILCTRDDIYYGNKCI